MPGIIVQWMAFGGFATALGLAEDMNRGLIDRFRSLPMARSAVLTGRTLSDIVTNSLAFAVMIGVGLIVGFSFSAPALGRHRRDRADAADRLRVLVGVRVGRAHRLVARSRRTRTASSSSSRSPSSRPRSCRRRPLPEPLKTFATDINPFSYMVDAARALFVGTPAGNDVWVSVLWCLGLIAGFSTLAVARYRRAVAS